MYFYHIFKNFSILKLWFYTDNLEKWDIMLYFTSIFIEFLKKFGMNIIGFIDNYKKISKNACSYYYLQIVGKNTYIYTKYFKLLI